MELMNRLLLLLDAVNYIRAVIQLQLNIKGTDHKKIKISQLVILPPLGQGGGAKYDDFKRKTRI